MQKLPHIIAFIITHLIGGAVTGLIYLCYYVPMREDPRKFIFITTIGFIAGVIIASTLFVVMSVLISSIQDLIEIKRAQRVKKAREALRKPFGVSTPAETTQQA